MYHSNGITARVISRILFVLAFLGFTGNVARAEDWMYERSWFTHRIDPGYDPNVVLPKSRSAYRTAYYYEDPSLRVRGQYRINNRVIYNGPRSDRTITYDAWIQPQVR